jgi:hypothetical protein
MHRAMDSAAAADFTLHCALALRLGERLVLSFSGVVALCSPFPIFHFRHLLPRFGFPRLRRLQLALRHFTALRFRLDQEQDNTPQ